MSWDKERIIELLLKAGDMAREARKKLTLEIKSDHSLVTQADTEIEALFTEALENVESGCYLVGEETINRKGEDYVQAALAGEVVSLEVREAGRMLELRGGAGPFGETVLAVARNGAHIASRDHYLADAVVHVVRDEEVARAVDHDAVRAMELRQEVRVVF